MFIAAPFTIAKIWKQPKCPSTNEWIKKMWCIYIHICIYTHTHMCIYTYTDVYIYIHIHTYVYTQNISQPLKRMK